MMEFFTDLFADIEEMNMKRKARKMKNRFFDFSSRFPYRVEHKESFGMSEFMMGLALGGALGYMAALLFAPQSGRETRAYISEKSRDISQKARDSVEDVVDMTSRKVTEGRERVESVMNKGQKQFDETKQQGHDYTYEARERLSDTLDRASDEVDPNPRF